MHNLAAKHFFRSKMKSSKAKPCSVNTTVYLRLCITVVSNMHEFRKRHLLFINKVNLSNSSYGVQVKPVSGVPGQNLDMNFFGTS